MDLVLQIIHAYSTVNNIAKIGDNVTDWVVRVVNKWSRETSSKGIEEAVARVATLTEKEIRQRDQHVFNKVPQSRVSPAQREAMIGVLANMARNVRVQASVGSLARVGGFFRSERLLDLLTLNIEPTRRVDEPVAPGSPWRLRRHLGMGSFGEVWLAENPDYPIPRAYKFFTKDGTGEWLRREQKSLVALMKEVGEHDGVVSFEDVQAQDCPHPYLAFEYMAGGSLEDYILDPSGRPARLTPGEVVRQVAAGLAAAHAKNIQHRDIKPANILLTGGADPRVKIGDFGLAKVAAATGGLPRPEASALASLVGTVGTPLYLPPEAQHRGIGRRRAAQDDVFALGVVWYQLLVGAIERPPYDYATRLERHGVDSQAIRIVERCLAHPDRRYKDAGELLDRLDGDQLPPIGPPAAGVPDVQSLALEYLAGTMVNRA